VNTKIMGEMTVTWEQTPERRGLLAHDVSAVHLGCGGCHLNLHTR
jgi:hypothetical protein